MNPFIVLLIAVGLSFDVFAAAIVEGAMLAKIEKKKLAILCAIFALWQMIALIGGDLFSMIPVFHAKAQELNKLWTTVSSILFFVLAIFMFYKAWKKDNILESVHELRFKAIFISAIILSIDAFVAGIAMGFLGAQLLIESLMLGIVTVLFVVGGIYTGYRLGAEQKPKALYAGSALLFIASVDVVARYIMA